MLEEIIDAVRRGGGIILSAQSPENYTSVKEGKANYVTRYDVAVQNFLKEELLKIAMLIRQSRTARHSWWTRSTGRPISSRDTGRAASPWRIRKTARCRSVLS